MEPLSGDTQAPFAPRLVTGAAFKALVDPQIQLQTSLGNVLLELHTSLAPATVANMLAYVRDGFYAGTLFHRVIPDFMAQGGGFTSGLVLQTPTYAPIPLESTNGVSNLRGTIAMARTSVPDSATSQFFINLEDNPFLNYAPAVPNVSNGTAGYAAFGRVVTGMPVVDTMALQPTIALNLSFENLPVNDIVITGMVQTLFGASISNTGQFTLAGLEAGATFEFSLDGGTHWTVGSGNSFVAPPGSYAANAIQVRQTDAAGNQSAVALFADALDVNAAHVVSTNQAPTGSVRISGIATLGQTLVADTGTLSDADGAGSLATPTYRWLRNGEFIPGATASSYTLVAGDLGASFDVRISYTDARGRVESLASGGSTLQGNAAANPLTGSDAADSISGLDGDDTLNGAYGADTLTGGSGNDVYYVDNVLDRIVELSDGGFDEVRVFGVPQGYPNYPTALAANVEAITLLGGANIYGLGNSLANTMLGNTGHNVLLGGSGNDVMDGGAGNDTLDGGSDNDNLGGGLGFDSLIGNLGNDTLRGGENADTLLGLDGDDYLNAGKGTDSLDGGTGNDTLIGALGTDLLIGGEGIDTADYSGSTDGVVVNLALAGAQQVSLATGLDTLAQIENLIGSNFHDNLSGDAGNNSLTGLQGNDLLSGLDGFDLLNGGDGDDNLNGGINADTLVGGLGHDFLSGGKGTDNLDGGEGNDSLSGGLGTDVLTGGAGADRFTFRTALDGTINIDTIADFASGLDLIELSASIFGAFAGQVGQTIGTNANLSYNNGNGELAYVLKIQNIINWKFGVKMLLTDGLTVIS